MAYLPIERLEVRVMNVGQGMGNVVCGYHTLDGTEYLSYLLVNDFGTTKNARGESDASSNELKALMEQRATFENTLNQENKQVDNWIQGTTLFIDAFILSHADFDHYSLLLTLLPLDSFPNITKANEKKEIIQRVKKMFTDERVNTINLESFIASYSGVRIKKDGTWNEAKFHQKALFNYNYDEKLINGDYEYTRTFSKPYIEDTIRFHFASDNETNDSIYRITMRWFSYEAVYWATITIALIGSYITGDDAEQKNVRVGLRSVSCDKEFNIEAKTGHHFCFYGKHKTNKIYHSYIKTNLVTLVNEIVELYGSIYFNMENVQQHFYSINVFLTSFTWFSPENIIQELIESSENISNNEVLRLGHFKTSDIDINESIASIFCAHCLENSSFKSPKIWLLTL